MFFDRTLNAKINKLHERALRILYKDDISTFHELLQKDKCVTMHDKCIQKLAIEMYRVKWNILPSSLSEFVTFKETRYDMRFQSDFERKSCKKVLSGTESLRILGPKIWDLIPKDIKSQTSLDNFKRNIRKWSIENCPCRICKDFVPNVGFL